MENNEVYIVPFIKEKYYIFYNNKIYGLTSFLIKSNKLYSSEDNLVKFDQKGFIIPKNKLKKVLYKVPVYYLENNDKIKYNYVVAKSNKKLDYAIIPVDPNYCYIPNKINENNNYIYSLVEFDLKNIQFYNGNHLTVSSFRIPEIKLAEQLFSIIKHTYDSTQSKQISKHFNTIIEQTKLVKKLSKKQYGK